MAEKTQKIGIFDSGLGGTTVLKEMIKSLPNEDYIYYGDNGNFPYGSGKTKNELQKLTERILDFFVKNNCKLVIVACNTASTAAIDYLREKFYDVMEALGMSHRPHDTRRTFATILSKLGASESVITDLMGHTSFKTTEKHYIQNDIETLKEAIGQIEKIN